MWHKLQGDIHAVRVGPVLVDGWGDAQQAHPRVSHLSAAAAASLSRLRCLPSHAQ